MLDLIERKTEDLDRLTVAIAQGYAISMDAEYNAQWQREHGASSPPPIASKYLGQMMIQFPKSFRVTRAN